MILLHIIVEKVVFRKVCPGRDGQRIVELRVSAEALGKCCEKKVAVVR